MQILLIAATEAEINPFTTVNTKIDVLITGLGVPSTIYHLQKRIQQMEYDIVIQAGIAGSFNSSLLLGQTVFVKQDCFADLGIEERGNYTPIFSTVFAEKNKFPFVEGWLVNLENNTNNLNLLSVKSITVNKISDSALQKQQLLSNFNADIETMEGAALHYVCLQEKIPFLQIRSISNYVGERDKSKWYMKEAIKNLNNTISKLINELIT